MVSSCLETFFFSRQPKIRDHFSQADRSVAHRSASELLLAYFIQSHDNLSCLNCRRGFGISFSWLQRPPTFTSGTAEEKKSLHTRSWLPSSWPCSISSRPSSGFDIYNSYPPPPPSWLSFSPPGVICAAPRPLIHALRSSGGDLVYLS